MSRTGHAMQREYSSQPRAGMADICVRMSCQVLRYSLSWKPPASTL
jgi:hypothetical protein